MANIKYLSYDGLSYVCTKLKTYINNQFNSVLTTDGISEMENTEAKIICGEVFGDQYVPED